MEYQKCMQEVLGFSLMEIFTLKALIIIYLHKTSISSTDSQLELNFWICKGWSEKAKLRTFATPGLENTFRRRAQHNPRKKETTTSENIFYKKKTSPICARTFCISFKTGGKLRRGKKSGHCKLSKDGDVFGSMRNWPTIYSFQP